LSPETYSNVAVRLTRNVFERNDEWTNEYAIKTNEFFDVLFLSQD
jgi:hypothetical protein